MTINSKHPTRAMAVANWFLERCWKDRDLSSYDQMKLYKLVFYAHGWYLGLCKTELFPEDVEAWPHGPVVPDLYKEFKDCRGDNINRLGKRMEYDDGKVTMIEPRHDGTLEDFFEGVWNVYGQYTGIQLSNMTHRPNEAWTIVAEKFNYDLSSKPIITSEIIEAVFARKVKEEAA